MDRCPTQAEILPQALALLPRGRAWSTHDGLPAEGTVLRRFWSAVAAVLAFANARICALREEFWCATQAETRDLWLAEYGLPDACDPFPDLCAKVAALGPTRCDEFAAIALRAGWAIECIFASGQAFGQCWSFGCSQFGATGDPNGTLRIRVLTASSPAWTAPPFTPWQFNQYQFGQPLGCGPDISGLQCLLARLVPAHCDVIWEIV